ncbi:MAG TPA: helix-turn-helix transcriptional regulator [Chthoniobacter sp.]|nr:helix-turn-helix transcriptional regulator [Chthoniobacter sp.]
MDKVNKCGLNPHVNAKVDKINNTAARFKEVRALLGLTQQDMANRLHIKRNTIAKIETGSAQPSARTVSSLEALLIESNRPKVDLTNASERVPGVEEDPVPYGTGDALKAQIRAKVEQAIDATGGDRVKLGWLLLQISEHARPQAHWSGQTVTQSPAEIKALAVLDKLRTRAAAEMHQTGEDSRRKTS